ncbi:MULTISPECIES: LPS export ABC transporter permease LptG [unclassified Bartonella]|uniref:LPS export ABC transporter permease LptG n=1 Tax=Bartonella TaxID=773 RepID=UPI00099A7B4A|nr:MULTISPECIES: LPS export ABC transporter permease LptG [unclassified Bartonella]AQX18533.1 lipopolysaccharide export system permease protein [Bartonella sp. A1379B]AQX23047.1 lipopolysaccharide export system permease protein [Bartonella sp. 11B]AQX23656.1 lipopolysaccharide export system permease protein [Bartonella sp. 114]AQX25502.1 lipopolysaccharide export system permease protein [Bartonella sp. Coyote22sub2]
MIGLTLGRYFFMLYLKTVCFFLLGVFILVLLIDFTENSSKLALLPHYTAKGAFLISLLRIPLIMQQLFPFIALFSAITMLISLNKKLELVVARSIGISAWQFLAPACFGAFLFGLFSILFINPLAAWSSSQAKKMIAEWRSNSAQISTTDTRIPWLTQHTNLGRITVGAKSIIYQDLSLIDATFVQYNENATVKNWINTKKATLTDGAWLLTNGTIYKIGQTPEKFTELRIKTHLKPEFLTEYLTDPITIPFYTLPKKIAVARSLGYSANKFDMHLQSLIALPMLLVAMTLIAATVSLKIPRFGQSRTLILGGVIAGFILYVISMLVRSFGNAGYIPPIIAAWVPVIVALFFAISFLLYTEDG